ncbi:MAG: hypothetical protein U1E56_13300 [Bauldia sp.]
MNSIKALALLAGLAIASANAAAVGPTAGLTGDPGADNYTRCSFATGESEKNSEALPSDCTIVAWSANE